MPKSKLDIHVFSPTDHPHPRIPQEIMDQIIVEAQDDKSTLKSCSLASSLLIAPSRKRLFGRVVFSGEDKARYEDFYHLTLTNPRLPTYVRSLRVDGLVYIRPERTILPTILKSFVNLRSLALIAGDYTATWASLGLQLQAALLDLIRSTPLTHIDIDIVSWPLSSFLHCHQLRELVVPFPAFKDPLIPYNIEPISGKVGFRVLHLGGSLHELCASFGTTHPDLRKLTICCWSAPEIAACQAILKSAADSLEELHVTLRSEIGGLQTSSQAIYAHIALC